MNPEQTYVVTALTADTKIVTNPGNKILAVVGWNIQALTAAVTWQFGSGGTATVISGAYTQAANAVNSQPVADKSVCRTVKGDDLYIKITTTGGNLVGTVVYEVRT